MSPRATTYAGPAPADLFPLASRYAELGAARGDTVREDRPGGPPFAYSERHLQCVWLDPRLRPEVLETAEGERVTVDHPGLWNLEAGPDFLGAVVRVGPDRRRVVGDVEIHIRPSGWKGHGHAADPRYRGVRVHVTYFPGRVPDEDLPPGTLQLALKAPLSTDPRFSFEVIDLTAYPYAQRAQVPPCSEVLADWSPEERALLLGAAGEERLRQKAERLRVAFRDRGRDQVVYEEVLTALGYKHNKTPFRALANRVPVDALREEAAGDLHVAYAVLAGVAGLLPARPDVHWDAETRRVVRRWWDIWWKRQARWGPRVMPRETWRLSALRPANQPLRRLMAAAFLFGGPRTLCEQWLAAVRAEPAGGLARAQEVLTGRPPTYWDRRFTLGGKKQDRRTALIGPGRARAILINVLVPFLAAVGEKRLAENRLLRRLPSEDDHHLVRQTAFFLFGPDHSASLYRDGLKRQGLVQIFHDFCLNDRSRCASCPFPQLLAAHRPKP